MNTPPPARGQREHARCAATATELHARQLQLRRDDISPTSADTRDAGPLSHTMDVGNFLRALMRESPGASSTAA